jgi:hypothetical protein
MNEQSKILIRCDLCDAIVAPEDIKQISVGVGGYLWIEEPTMHGTHFACKTCLERIGLKESPENEKPADTPNAAGSSNNNTSPSI